MTTQPQLPTEILEKRAAEQRRALHNRVQELRSTIRHEIRERTDLKRNIRRHFAPIAGATAVVALGLGYGAAGIFTRY
jgi:fatty acid desaturase